MRVVSFGISIAAGNPFISIADLFRSMQLDNGKEDSSKGTPRIFYIDDHSDKDFFRGLVVTIRDQNAFCKWVQSGTGNFKIKVENLKKAEKIMDFNLFVIRKKTGLGIYQYYHRSCSTNTFLSYLRRKYRALSDDHMENALAALGNAPELKKRAVRKKYRKPLDAGLLIRTESLEKVLEHYQSVKSFSFELISLQAKREAAGPLEPVARKVRQTISFIPDATKKKIASAIGDVMSRINPRSARVAVTDDDDEALSLKILNIPENFGEADYDDVAAELEGLDVSQFSNHAAVLRLRKTCTHQYPEVFITEC